MASATAKSISPTNRGAKRPPLLTPVPRPNDEEFRKRLEEVQTTVTRLQTQAAKFQEEIDSKRHGHGEFENKKAEIYQKVDEYTKAIDGLSNEKNVLLQQRGAEQEHFKARKNEVAKLKKSMPFTSVEAVDEELSRLESQLMHTSMSLQEEKKLVARIEALKRMKPQVESVSSSISMRSPAGDASSGAVIKSRLDDLRSEVDTLKEKRSLENQKLKDLYSERSSATAPIKDLTQKKSEIQATIQEERFKLNAIREEQKTSQQKYSAYLTKLRQARRDAERIDRRMNELKTKREKLEAQVEDLELEGDNIPGILMLQQTVAYTEKLHLEAGGGADKKADSLDVKDDGANAAMEAQMDGEYTCIRPKKDREEEFFLAPSKKKGGRKARKGGQKAGVISHDVHTWADFAKLGLEPPLNYTEVEETLKVLKEKLSVLEGRRSEFEQANSRKKEKLRAELNAVIRQEKAEFKQDEEDTIAAAEAAEQSAIGAEGA